MITLDGGDAGSAALIETRYELDALVALTRAEPKLGKAPPSLPRSSASVVSQNASEDETSAHTKSTISGHRPRMRLSISSGGAYEAGGGLA